MTRYTSNPIKRRNALLVAGVCLMIPAIWVAPLPILPRPSPHGLLGLVVVIASAFMAIQGIREIADVCLHESNWPWYARRGAAAYLPLALLAVNTLAGLALVWGLGAFGLAHLISPHVMLLQLTAMELLFIPILDWPSGSSLRRTKSAPEAKNEYKPVFKPFQDEGK